ncbi:dihydrofolate reductase [Hoyosella rhizosphaerae]|nr:dihydrofolate reductase family protein [Hoyosella rhizosphaerae]MBN4925261.1 dihydrofolate reductase [Hoyosella rhizosphaerae]
MKTQFFTASSLDGFIATDEDSLDWLITREHFPDGVLNYRDFIADVGAIVMGSTTYEWVLNSGEPWDYTMPCWVLTSRESLPLPAGDANVTFSNAGIRQVHADMVDAAQGRNIWVVGGGDVAGQFADAGVLDELIVSFAPVTLGSGKPLLPRHVELRLEECGQNGEFLCARYSVVR